MPLITADSDFKNVDTIDLIYFERWIYLIKSSFTVIASEAKQHCHW
jgi:hypothetical protein